MNTVEDCIEFLRTVMNSYHIGECDYARHSDLVIQHIENHSFTYLGGGHFSLVFSHPVLGDDKVFKINLKKDSSYSAWMDYCQEMDHPMLPKVYGRRKFDDKELFILPRYERLRDDDWNQYKAIAIGMGYSSSNSIEANREAQKLFKDFEARMRHLQWCTDVSSDNVMRDPNTGHLVITDPIA